MAHGQPARSRPARPPAGARAPAPAGSTAVGREPVERHRVLDPERADRLAPERRQVRADPQPLAQIAGQGPDVGPGAHRGPEDQLGRRPASTSSIAVDRDRGLGRIHRARRAAPAGSFARRPRAWPSTRGGALALLAQRSRPAPRRTRSPRAPDGVRRLTQRRARQVVGVRRDAQPRRGEIGLRAPPRRTGPAASPVRRAATSSPVANGSSVPV